MAIYNWFTHWKGWFSIVFCMFTRGYPLTVDDHGYDNGLWECPGVTSSWSSCPRARVWGETASCLEPEQGGRWRKPRCGHWGIITSQWYGWNMLKLMLLLLMMMMVIVKINTCNLYEFDTVNQIWKTRENARFPREHVLQTASIPKLC